VPKKRGEGHSTKGRRRGVITDPFLATTGEVGTANSPSL